MSTPTPKGLIERFFQACVLILGGVLALWIALSVLAHIWGWLLLIAGIALLVAAGVVAFRWWRARRW